jgi:hypothetical protein
MKRSLQTLSEAEVAACVLAASFIALILMVSYAVWKSIASEPVQNSQSDDPINVAVCSDTHFLDPVSATDVPREFRNRVVLKKQLAPVGARFL